MAINRTEGRSTEATLQEMGDKQKDAILKTGQSAMSGIEGGLKKAGDAVAKGNSMSVDEKAQARGIEDLKGAKPQEPKSAGGIQASGAASQAEPKPTV